MSGRETKKPVCLQRGFLSSPSLDQQFSFSENFFPVPSFHKIRAVEAYIM